MFKNSVFNPSIDTKKWILNAGIRAIKTFAQTAVALIPAGAIITDVDYKVILGTALLSAVVSILTSLGGIPEVSEDADAWCN